MKKFNPWQISTLVLLLMIGIVGGMTYSFRLHNFSIIAAVETIALLVLIILLIQLPQILKLLITQSKERGKEHEN